MLHEVGEAVAGLGLRLRRAWPRSAEHVLLDLGPVGGGRATAGQWFADPERARRVANATLAAAGGPEAQHGVGAAGTGLVPATGVVCQPHGADRRLSPVRALAAADGAVLLSHRPERRAVVRLASGEYAKVVRPERVAAVASAARTAAVDGLRTPAVVAVDPTGLVIAAPLPGRSLHEVLADRRASESVVVAAAHATGEALARLHAAPAPTDAPTHEAADEAEVAARWVGLASAHALLTRDLARALRQATEGVRQQLADRRGNEERCRLHRDLHDKQVLLDGEEVGLIDFDLAAVGEPALDLANLLVHLELRFRQGLIDAERLLACRDAVTEGYRPSARTARRLPAYTLASRVRLVSVYAFRPDSAAAAARLLQPI